MHVVDRIRESSGQFALDPAVIDAGSGASWSHAQLWDRVDRLSAALDRLGLHRGDVVAAWLPNSHEAIEAELAALQSGYIWMALNTRLTWPEVQAAIGSCEPAALIADPKCMARPQTLAAIQDGGEAGKSRAIPRLILTGDERRTKKFASVASLPWISFEESIEETMPRRPELEIDEGDIARLRYTSGTTGGARAAVLTHGVYLASLENLQTELHTLGSSDRALHAAPLTHASGAMMYPVLAAGGANVIVEKFDPDVCLDLIEHHGITTMFAVPTILHRLAAAARFEAADLSSLRTVMYGGAPMAVEKLAPFIERIGPALVHIYGMTEAPYPITTLGRDEHWVGNPKLGSIGKPTKICELRIRSGDCDVPDDCMAEEVGEIWIRGRNVMAGYWRDEEATREVLRDGWLASGDLGRRDADGYYWIVDRTKDVIISGGFNVYAREVEMTLSAHEAVAEAAVVGIKHTDWGETIAAFIVPHPGASLGPEEIGSWCRARLSGYKCPRHIELLHEMPRNSSGKILKQALARRHEGSAS